MFLAYCNTDHPRSCGANRTQVFETSSETGSSPLVRGQRPHHTRRTTTVRIIPARAGPTERSAAIAFDVADHPRSCGANLRALLTFSATCGSSPLVRGQQACDVGIRIAERIIPARAGPTELSPARHPAATDHPRSCGANVRSSVVVYTSVGSSPLVRGQQSDFTRKKRVESNKNI